MCFFVFVVVVGTVIVTVIVNLANSVPVAPIDRIALGASRRRWSIERWTSV